VSGSAVIGTLGAVVLFCIAFLRGRFFGLLDRLGQRTFVSVAGGAAVAYVFLDLMPQLNAAAGTFHAATAHFAMRLLSLGVYLATMVGFLFFYGFEVLVLRARSEEDRRRPRGMLTAHPLFRTHVAVFAVYAWLVSYLMVRSLEHTAAQFAFYTVAMSLHFMSVTHALREEHGSRYDRFGSPVLAAGCVAGWACGLAFGMPEPALAILLGVVAGGVIASTVISELPHEKQGRFVPFVVGAVVYAALLIVAG
jgi:hypothetical protein